MDAYYYLVAGLPDISLEDGKLSYTVDSFKSEIYPDLSDKDKKVIDLFYLKLDNDNLLHLLKDKDYAVVSQGMYSAEELLSVIDTVKDGDIPDKKYPSYFCNFISKYLKLNPEDLYKAGDMLAAQYYAYAMNCKNKFVSAWFEFNLNLNNIQAALSARKYKLDIASAIVGNTDSHGSTEYNPIMKTARTIVFARENTRDALVCAIKEFYSAAVQDIGEHLEVLGDLRMMKYAWFLLGNYFPLHDELCFEEGRLMKAYACGDMDAGEELRRISGRVQRLREKYFLF